MLYELTDEQVADIKRALADNTPGQRLAEALSQPVTFDKASWRAGYDEGVAVMASLVTGHDPR